MPRSSTTLVEQILSSHSKVFGAGEVEFIPDLVKEKINKKDLKKIGEEYINKMKNISSNSDRTTDKLPTNFLYIGFIKLILPKSKIVHCFRNSRDNCLSIFKNQFSSGKIKFAYDLNEIVFYYNLFEDLMRYWRKLFPNFIYDLKYEHLISNTKKQTQSLLNNCDLNWTNDCLNFYNNERLIRSASDTQVRSKIYNSSINSWKSFDKYLDKYFRKLKR